MTLFRKDRVLSHQSLLKLGPYFFEVNQPALSRESAMRQPDTEMNACVLPIGLNAQYSNILLVNVRFNFIQGSTALSDRTYFLCHKLVLEIQEKKI